MNWKRAPLKRSLNVLTEGSSNGHGGDGFSRNAGRCVSVGRHELGALQTFVSDVSDAVIDPLGALGMADD